MFKEIGLQKILMIFFIAVTIIALIVFSGLVKVGKSSQQASGNIIVWGTIPTKTMQPYIEKSQTKDLKIQYKVQDEETYESDLINAFAAGEGPDLFIMPHEYILRHSNKVFEIPYASFPKNIYQSTYIDESDLFLSENGVIAMPVLVDPLIMYYNKTLVSSAFVLNIPEYWDEFLDFASQVTVANSNGEVSISAVSMGTYSNISSAKDIISTLILQNGNNIVGTDPVTTKKRSELTFTLEGFEASKQALEFFTSFSRSSNQNYSWNESLPLSRDAFIAGDLAIYFGRASELESIRKKNPNLDFNIALMPQVRDSRRKLTHGSMTGIAISKQTRNPSAAIAVAAKIAGADVAGDLARDLFVAPARKDLLQNKPDNAQETLFYNSAVISEGWLDADPDITDGLFQRMVRDINTGAGNFNDILSRTQNDLNAILNRTINLGITDQSIQG